MNEELKTPAETNQKPIIDSLKGIYENLSPEKQVIFGVFASYIYLVMLTSPDSLPDKVQPIIELLNKMPMSSVGIWITTMTVMVGSADGVRRVIAERLPLYKAYTQVFLLHKFEDKNNDS